jgi:hypothetical protein
MKPILVGTLLVFSVASLAADEEPAAQSFLPWSVAEVKPGGVFTAIDSKAGFTAQGGGQTKIDMEDKLGLDSEVAVFRVDALLRLGARQRHRLDFSYVGYYRSAEKTLTEGIAIGGQQLTPGTVVDSKLDFALFRGSYSYAVFQNERVSVGVGLGAYVVPVTYGVDVRAANNSSGLESYSATLPLPAIALRGDFQLIPKLFLVSELDFMYLDVSGIRAGLLDTHLALEYQPWKHAGFGLGFNLMGANFESTEQSGDYPGFAALNSVHIRTAGLMVYGKVCF